MHGLTGFVVRRLLLGLVTLWITSVIIFAATQALPGDAARSILGRSATPESLAELRRQLGLDKPVLTQYWEWISGVLTGDLGTSLANSLPVTEVIGERLVYSLFLMVLAAVISVPFGIALGAASARRRDSAFDQTTSVTTLGLAALPEFVVGITLVVLFATTVFEWLPAVAVTEPGVGPWNYPKELILPVVTLVIAVVPYTARIMRASTVEILESDFVEMARLKGLPERRVLWRHAVPNALAPTFQVAALNLAYLAGGIVVVEAVFNYQGIGLLLVDSVRARDMPVVQAVALLIAGDVRRAEPAGRPRDDPRQPTPADVPVMSGIAVADEPVEVDLDEAPGRPWRAPLLHRMVAAPHEDRARHHAPDRRDRVHRAVRRTVRARPGRRGPVPVRTAVERRRGSAPTTSAATCSAASSPVASPCSSSPASSTAHRAWSLGVAVGLVAAYSRGKLDDLLMRSMDVLLSLPQIVFALVLAATVGPELWLLVLAVGLTTMPRAARVTRGAAVEVVEKDFVRAAEAIGLPRRRILMGEVLPEHREPAHRRDDAADDVQRRRRRGAELPRLRPATSGGRLGADDQREPERPHHPALAGASCP